MKIVATICSKRKREDAGLLPARQRYTSAHVEAVGKIADETQAAFFILSGKYGLISADEKIPYYDYYLEENAADELSLVIKEQIQKAGITEIDFYSEDKDSWKPYQSAIKKGSELSGTTLRIRPVV